MPEIPISPGASEFANIGNAAKGAAAGIAATTAATEQLRSTLLGVVGHGAVAGLVIDFLDRWGLGVNKLQNTLGMSDRAIRAWGGTMFSVVSTMRNLDMATAQAIRTVAEMNVQMGRLDITTRQYFNNLASNVFTHGKIWTNTAKDVDSLLSRVKRLTGEELVGPGRESLINTILGSPATARDLENFVVRLAGKWQDFPNIIAEISGLATEARVPFEEYKNLIFEISERYHMWGVNIEDVAQQISLFNEDLANQNITMEEAGRIASTINDVLLAPNNTQQRILLSREVQRTTGAFSGMSPMDAAAALYELNVRDPAAALSLIRQTVQRPAAGGVISQILQMPQEVQLQQIPKMFGFGFEEFQTLRGLRETKVKPPEEREELTRRQTDVMNKLAKEMSEDGVFGKIGRLFHSLNLKFQAFLGGESAGTRTALEGGALLAALVGLGVGGKLMWPLAAAGGLTLTQQQTAAGTAGFGEPSTTSSSLSRILETAVGFQLGQKMGQGFLGAALPALMRLFLPAAAVGTVVGLGALGVKGVIDEAKDIGIKNTLLNLVDPTHIAGTIRDVRERGLAAQERKAMGVGGSLGLLERIQAGPEASPFVSNKGAPLGIKVEVTVDESKFRDYVSDVGNAQRSMQK